MRSVGIIGMGHYVPEKTLTNADLEKTLGLPAETILRLSGINERHIAAAEEATSDLAAKAARLALANAKAKPDEIDMIIVATCSPDCYGPSTAAAVQEHLQARRAAAFDLAAACSGFVYGLVVGCNLIRAELYRKVLVIGSDVLSRITDSQDPDTAILFGDGAGAVVLGEVPAGYGLLGTDLGADGSGFDTIKVPAGGSRLPTSAETVAQRLHYTKMDGASVVMFGMRVLGESVKRSLAAAGLGPGAIDLLVPHQANLRIIEAAARRMDFPLEKTVINIDHCGNTSSASVPIALSEAAAAGRIRRGDRVVLVGFGAGLAWASCVLKWH
ncbi:3-oxoacyl-ACP synthase III family protein [Anaeroselena agilis]|uniref:Beta-ketoacyl-[acyl-carrier-protein] synthase III n=1 Tax=Anaeroselena agilis TaxID=3063788 RepID=A0ABU3P720_9FIRM|nr:beta-ketoacyl-ACP synthase III [Selenomonadales bacterium 4137-cl]